MLDRPARQPLVDRRIADADSDLAGEDYLVPLAAQDASENRLRRTGVVHVRRVNEVDAMRERRGNHRRRSALVDLSAVGGVILFVSAMCYVGVLVGTMLVSPLGATQSIEYAASLVPPTPGPSIWDRFGRWTAIAVVLVILAYAQPLYHLHTLARFPSRGFSPF